MTPMKKNKYAICFVFLFDVTFKGLTKLVFKEITPKQKARTNKISVNNGNQILPLYK